MHCVLAVAQGTELPQMGAPVLEGHNVWAKVNFSAIVEEPDEAANVTTLPAGNGSNATKPCTPGLSPECPDDCK